MSEKKFIILLLLGVLIGIFTQSCTRVEKKSFSFVQICDPQLGMGGYEKDVASFSQAVAQINELEPAFVIICGDLVQHANDSSFSDFLEIKNGFTVPCYISPGNHDIGNPPNDSTLLYYRENLGKDYYAFRKKGFNFIITNSLLWKSDIGQESEDHDRWFRQTLARMARNNRPIIVAGHYPLYVDGYDEEENYFNLPYPIRLDLLQLFSENKVKAYLSGHKHKTLLNRFENTLMVTGESTSKNFDMRPLGYRLWKVWGDSISHEFIALEMANNKNF